MKKHSSAIDAAMECWVMRGFTHRGYQSVVGVAEIPGDEVDLEKLCAEMDEFSKTFHTHRE